VIGGWEGGKAKKVDEKWLGLLIIGECVK